MDRRSWPWKRKSSDKTATEKAAALLDSAGFSAPSTGLQAGHNTYKKPNYVQISVESYSHLTALEEQVKIYEEQAKNYEQQVKQYEVQVNDYEEQLKRCEVQVNDYEEKVQSLEDQNKELNEKLSAVHVEMTNKENLVKQHAKVAEDAVSGWEKAEAEALALKCHLESITLSKLTAEDRASHLDGALKECMRQIRNLKEEHEQKLQEFVLIKTKQWEKIKHDLKANIASLDQKLLRSEAENAAISRSLQERSSMLIKISEEKSQAEAEIVLLSNNIESCKMEINSLKYEVHVVSKELEIRNEEKNISIKSAEAANKQHAEAVKKIAKLEAECQRLRGLVRKRLPGPAALAQMKLEVESWGRECGETRTKRSPAKPPSPHIPSVTEFSADNIQKVNKDNEFLTARLLAMEEETKMLKEALAKRNSELQASRNLCAKTATKVQSLESQLQHHQGCPLKFNVQALAPQNSSNPPSITSMSEDGNDDVASCAESWATSSISVFSQIKKEENSEKVNKTDNAHNLALMDDFLEMEKLACLANDSNGAMPLSDSLNTNTSKVLQRNASGGNSMEKQQNVSISNSSVSDKAISNGELATTHPGSEANQPALQNLRVRILSIFESVSKDTNSMKILEEIKQLVQEGYDSLHLSSASCVSPGKQCSDGTGNAEACPEGSGVTAGKEIASPQNIEPAKGLVYLLSQGLVDAITKIHNFAVCLGKEARTAVDCDYLSEKIEELSVTFDKVLHSDTSLVNFVVDLSHVLAKASELSFSFLRYKCTESEISSSDCIDKVAFPEDKLFHKDSSGGIYHNNCPNISNPEVPDCGNLVMGYESNTRSCEISLENYDQLKSQRDNMANDLTRYLESLEMTKSELQGKEQLLTEVKSRLASARDSNSLAETQLKCMTESYRTLEKHAKGLETEVNLLREKMDILENKLQEERSSHQNALARCKDLEDRLQRTESCTVCASSSAADTGIKTKQERELASAAGNLAKCQETIFLLDEQLSGLRSPTESMRSGRSQEGDAIADEESAARCVNLQDFDQSEMETATSNLQRPSAEFPLDLNIGSSGPNDAEAHRLAKSPSHSKQPKHRHTRSSSSSSSSGTIPD